MTHPTDEEIQAYLDSSPGQADAELRHHLDTCRQCGKVLADYRSLCARLADETAFSIPHGIADSVLSRLGLKEKSRGLQVPGDFVLVACAIVAMVIGISLFADLGLLFDAVSSVGRPILAYASPHLESAHSCLAESGRTPGIVMTGVFILVLTWFLDLVFKLKRLSDIRRQAR
jgi:hypothetical protein